MGLNIGNTTIGGIYLGNTKISEAYLGSTKIYSAAPPGPTFDYVTIGSQIWMSKNLAIDDGQGGIYTQTVDYGQGNVVEYYYNWAAALRVVASISGWHLPTKDEWTTLATTAGGTSYAGTKLKSTYGWTSGNGTDIYGFAGFPAGRHVGSNFSDLGKQAYFWTSTEYSAAEAYYQNLYSRAAISGGHCNKNVYRNTVRLVKD